MAEQHYTLYLDQATGDLTLDAYGNIAVCSQPYAVAQDVASAVKLLLGELYYDQAKGVPFFQKIAGKGLSSQAFNAIIETQALNVPDVVKAKCISSFDQITRRITGTIFVTDTNGIEQGVTL